MSKIQCSVCLRRVEMHRGAASRPWTVETEELDIHMRLMMQDQGVSIESGRFCGCDKTCGLSIETRT
jgi:hypothetical protein